MYIFQQNSDQCTQDKLGHQIQPSIRLCRTPHKLVLWKSSTLFSPFLEKPSLAGHHVTWNIAYSAVKSLYIMLQYFTPCYTFFFLNQDSYRTLWQSILQVKVTCSSPSTTNWKKGLLLFFNLMSGNVFWWMSTEDRFVVLWGQQERSGNEQIRYSFINSGLWKPHISAVFSEWANHKFVPHCKVVFYNPVSKPPDHQNHKVR